MIADHTSKVTVLGSTGSIGVNTLDVIERHHNFSLFALTAHSNVSLLAEQCLKFKPNYAVLGNQADADHLRSILDSASIATEVLTGAKALEEVAADSQVDIVMAAIVGAAGLLPTMAAVHAGKKVLLANKESLVMAGSLFMAAVADSNAVLLPIDSEHNAMYQCLPQSPSATHEPRLSEDLSCIRKLLLTGSGGPFRTWAASDIRKATPEQACNHPNWSMGKKISVDSATLMNKGLEFIEAKWLFNIDPSKIEVIIHPQSVIHSMVEYVDGSILAQLGNPDMRTPIAHALAYPERIESGVGSLDIITTARLDFEEPNHEKFPALELAVAAAESGTGAATVLNAANEVAVETFLKNGLEFGQIADVLAMVMDGAVWSEPESLAAVIDLDQYSRKLAVQALTSLTD